MTKKRAEKPAASGEGSPLPPGRGRSYRLKTMNDVRVEMARVYSDARRKQIEPETASKLTYILGQIGKVIEGGSFEERMREIEKRLGVKE